MLYMWTYTFTYKHRRACTCAHIHAHKINIKKPTWCWCWYRWCTRFHQSKGSGKWSCWFGSATTPCSSFENDTLPKEPDPSISTPAQGKKIALVLISTESHLNQEQRQKLLRRLYLMIMGILNIRILADILMAIAKSWKWKLCHSLI